MTEDSMPEESTADQFEPADAGSLSSSGTATAAPTKKPGAPTRGPAELPPYKVLLHNDDVNDFEYVIHSVLKLTCLSREEAILRTLEAHESGVALLLVTHRERAELYAEQFTSCKITVTLELAE